jgi:hypothetical protein
MSEQNARARRQHSGSYMMPAMPLSELHPLCDVEIVNLPAKPGVFVLFQIEVPVHADGAGNLRQALRSARSRFPQASHFSVELLDSQAVPARIQQLRTQLRLVRTASFIGR